MGTVFLLVAVVIGVYNDPPQEYRPLTLERMPSTKVCEQVATKYTSNPKFNHLYVECFEVDDGKASIRKATPPLQRKEAPPITGSLGRITDPTATTPITQGRNRIPSYRQQ